MIKFDRNNPYTKIMLGVMAGVAVTGILGSPGIYAASHDVLVQVRNNATLTPEKEAMCSFVFEPSGTTINATANPGGVAMVTAPTGDNSTTVSCMGTDGTSGSATSPLKAMGDTVIRVLTS